MMAKIVSLLVCVTLLAGSAHTVEANQGDVKQLKDDPRGTPEEYYTQVIKALEEKILAIQTGLSDLNNTVIANQKEVMRVNSNVSRNSRDISTNTNGIKTNQKSIAANNEDIHYYSKKLDQLAVFPCNCSDALVDAYYTLCKSSTAVSQGFGTYCKGSNCTNAWTPTADLAANRGVRCCELCTGTAEESAAYALANPPPPAMWSQATYKP